MNLARAALLSVALASCELPCAPGEVLGTSNVFQSLEAPIAPIEFRFLEGSCGSKVPPEPQVRIKGENGQTRVGTAELRSYRPAGFAENSVIEAKVFGSPFEGRNTIELEFGPSILRRGEAYFVTPQSGTTIASVEGRCIGQPYLGPQFVTCSVREDDGSLNVKEFLVDGGVTQIASASLWTTSQGRLITTSNEIGWWDGTTLADWRGTASLTSSAIAVAANSTVVAVWQADGALVLRSPDDLTVEIARVSLASCDDDCSSSASLVISQDAM